MASENFSVTDGLLYALLYVYILTFTLYPGVALDTTLSFFSNLPNSRSWFIVFMNTIYSLFDTIGRKLGSMEQFDVDPLGIKIISLGRSIFIATFMFIAFKVHP